ncbi:MAG TPA: plastocyanin/azurin family copper-binding protein [Actinomycetota bacterium]|nr:plastocyanin/azurin family copper-binding protein [Actinomycetota bacterium]
MTIRLIIAAALSMAATVVCSGENSGDVAMTSAQRFDPSTITVSVGEPVVFVNNSNEAHTVTAVEDTLPDGGSYFASGGFTDEAAARSNPSDGFILEGEIFEIEFGAPGTYEYFCIPHESSGMRGTIIVEE